MTTLLIIIAVIIGAYVLGNIATPPSPKTKQKTKEISKSENNGVLLYKNKGVKTFDIKGTFYRKNITEEDSGEFLGYVKCENNSHDAYTVEIYSKNNKHLGYVPKGNKRLNESLWEWHSGKLIAWGNLRFDDYNNKWYGNINIPLGIDEKQIKNIENLFELKKTNKAILASANLTLNEYFEVLENQVEIDNLVQIINLPELNNDGLPKNIIPRISKKLETEKNWLKLIELEKYSNFINELSETFKISTLNRIEKAKKNLP